VEKEGVSTTQPAHTPSNHTVRPTNPATHSQYSRLDRVKAEATPLLAPPRRFSARKRAIASSTFCSDHNANCERSVKPNLSLLMLSTPPIFGW